MGDIGAIDIAAIDVKPHSGEHDVQKDACLLFRGKPVKCYVLPTQPTNGPGQSVYDESNVMDVVYPDTVDHMHDALNFARITSPGVGRSFTAGDNGPTNWRYEGKFLILEWADDVTTGGTNERVAPGIQAGSVIEITSWEATHDVTYVLSRNRNRFYVEEAGEFFIKIDTGLAHWRYVEGSYNPCDSTNTGDYTQRLADERCADPPWIASANNKVPLCDVMGPRCRRGTDKTDCARGATLSPFDATYASIWLGAGAGATYASDDSCVFAGNGVCDEMASGEHHVYRTLPRGGVGGTPEPYDPIAYKFGMVGAGSATDDPLRTEPRWQDMGYRFASMTTSCATSEYETNFLADRATCGTGSCGDGINVGSGPNGSPIRDMCMVGNQPEQCGKRFMTFGRDVTKQVFVQDPDNVASQHETYLRNQGAISFTIVEAPAPTNVGPVSTGGGAGGEASGMGFIVTRQHSQPTVLFAMPGQAGVATGATIQGVPTSSAATSLGVAGSTLVVTTATGNINVFMGAERSAARLMTEITDSRGGAQDALLCNLHNTADGAFELVLAGDGTSPRVFQASATGDWTEGSSVILDDAATDSVNNPRPFSVRVFCADINNDGKTDVIVHRTAENAASCAYRCYELGRWGYDLDRVDGSGNPIESCVCGPHLSLAMGPSPPPEPATRATGSSLAVHSAVPSSTTAAERAAALSTYPPRRAVYHIRPRGLHFTITAPEPTAATTAVPRRRRRRTRRCHRRRRRLPSRHPRLRHRRHPTRHRRRRRRRPPPSPPKPPPPPSSPPPMPSDPAHPRHAELAHDLLQHRSSAARHHTRRRRDGVAYHQRGHRRVAARIPRHDLH